MKGLRITLGQVEYRARPFVIGGSQGVVEMKGLKITQGQEEYGAYITLSQVEYGARGPGVGQLPHRLRAQ
jgi:hypothetical protein